VGPWRINAVTARPCGVTLIAALICLLVVMLFSSVVVRALVMRQRASRSDEQQLQCLFLIESAVERTKARCAAEPNFSGETWTVSLDDRGVARSGIASIRVEPVANEPRRRQIHIDARWPDDPILRVQRTKELIITLPVPGAAS
jgi:Tfp pilus assembly protein PilV